MSAPQFTPGPWSLAPDKGNITRDILGSDGKSICSVWNVRHHLLKDPTADTNLILAAPELYEALETIAELTEHENYGQFRRECQRICGAALAKARGEQVSA